MIIITIKICTIICRNYTSVDLIAVARGVLSIHTTETGTPKNPRKIYIAYVSKTTITRIDSQKDTEGIRREAGILKLELIYIPSIKPPHWKVKMYERAD